MEEKKVKRKTKKIIDIEVKDNEKDIVNKTKEEDLNLDNIDNIKSENTDTNNKVPKKENKAKEFIKRHKDGILYIVITFAICLLLFGSFYEFYLKNLVVETTKLEKDVTITDTGIADAVEKVYDSVVVIETFVNKQAYASGTGFVFKTDDNYGYILTNYHVIEGSTSVNVTFTNNKTIECEVVGSDEYSDIAVLRVSKSDVILVAETGSSDDMRVGDTTFAVGAPIDSSVYSWTVTRGILSGKERLVEVSTGNTSTYVMEVLQTDTAINSGNSGGPLCNSNGEVIGITNMKIASSSIEGMGFAIPIDTAISYADSIISGKSIVRPYLGVSIYDASSYFNTETGVYIEYVESGSSAAKAGLQKGDKILKIDDTEITSTSYFKYQLYKYNIGDKITITIERNGKEKQITVTLKGSGVTN